MFKIEKALASGNSVKSVSREIEFFGRVAQKINIHTVTRRKPFRLLNLIFRNIRTRKTRAVLVHITGNNSRSRADAKHFLTRNAYSE